MGWAGEGGGGGGGVGWVDECCTYGFPSLYRGEYIIRNGQQL